MSEVGENDAMDVDAECIEEFMESEETCDFPPTQRAEKHMLWNGFVLNRQEIPTAHINELVNEIANSTKKPVSNNQKAQLKSASVLDLSCILYFQLTFSFLEERAFIRFFIAKID